MPMAPRVAAGVRGAAVGSPAAGLALVAAVVLVFVAADGGGFAPTTWYPFALFASGLLVVGLAAVPQATPPLVLAAAVGMGAYALWSYLTIAWADQKGDAWDGANRTLLYAVVFALFALWRLRARAAALVLGVLVVGVAVLALVELLRAANAADPGDFFFEGRFSSPATYQNANVALWTMALWPAVILASRRGLPGAARAALAAAAVVLGAAALLGQSRGWLFAVPVTALVVLAITPQRVRLVLTGLLVGGAVAAISGPLLDVYDASDGTGFGAAVGDAVRAIVLVAAVVAAVVGVAAWLEHRRPRPAREVERRAGRALLVTGVVAAVVGLALFVSTVGSPFTALADGWNTFKTQPHATGEGSRFSQSLGSYRYDFWRVAWSQFRDHPLGGIGADNFQQAYLLERKGDQDPRYPHASSRATRRPRCIGSSTSRSVRSSTSCPTSSLPSTRS
jgi:O-antigen ligase